MRLCPRRPVAGVDPLVTQQKCTQLLARRSHRTHRRQASADQVAHRLVCRIRHPNRGQQAPSVQHGQTCGVALVGLLPLAAFARDHRWCDDHAVFAHPGEGAVHTVAAGTGFIAELDRPAAGLPQTLDQLLQPCGGVGECAIGRGLANLAGGRDRDDDGLFVHIHADKSCRLFHDPSPVPEAPRQTIRRDPRSSTHRDDGSPLQAGYGHEVWFVGLSIEAPVWDVTVFSKNRDRLLEGDMAHGFLRDLADPQVKRLLSSEHVSVDGTLIEAWASMKSFRPKDGSGAPPGPGRNGARDFHGQTRSNETHASRTDPDARLSKKAAGQAAKLCHMGHVLIENRSCLVVDTRTTLATGTAEREAAMIAAIPGQHRITVGCDKAYGTQDFVADVRGLGATPHVTQNDKARRSAIDGRTTRHWGYQVSLLVRKRIEETFGWMKTIGGQRKTRYRGTPRVGWMFTLSAAAYNLIRLPKLLGAAA